MSRAALALFAAGMVALSGCGPSTATVSGKVTYQGKPVVSGSVTVKAADGTVHQIGLNPDGSFRLDAVPTGPATVGVASPDPKPSSRFEKDDPRRPEPVAGWFPLPPKFADPATSGLTLTVGSGSADLDLK